MNERAVFSETNEVPERAVPIERIERLERALFSETKRKIGASRRKANEANRWSEPSTKNETRSESVYPQDTERTFQVSEVLKRVTVQRERVNLQGSLVRESPYPIYLFDNGKFGAKRNAEWVFGGSLKTVEKKMAVVCKAIKVFAPYAQEDCRVEEVSEYRRSGQRSRLVTRDGSESRLQRWSAFYFYDEKLVKALNVLGKEEAALHERYEKERNALEAKRDKILEKAEEVDLHRLNEIVAERGT